MWCANRLRVNCAGMRVCGRCGTNTLAPVEILTILTCRPNSCASAAITRHTERTTGCGSAGSWQHLPSEHQRYSEAQAAAETAEFTGPGLGEAAWAGAAIDPDNSASNNYSRTGLANSV